MKKIELQQNNELMTAQAHFNPYRLSLLNPITRLNAALEGRKL